MSIIDARTDHIAQVCRLVSDAGAEAALSYLDAQYPFAPVGRVKRRYGPLEATQVFVRDGFLDRYSGDRLIFPPVLRLLSALLGDRFPYTPAWRTDATHSAYWEVGATVDHIEPVTLGGADGESNWVTTSMARNFAKMNWRLVDLGWTLHPPGDIRNWDGMLGWFVETCDRSPELVRSGSMRTWHQAALKARREV